MFLVNYRNLKMGKMLKRMATAQLRLKFLRLLRLVRNLKGCPTNLDIPI